MFKKHLYTDVFMIINIYSGNTNPQELFIIKFGTFPSKLMFSFFLLRLVVNGDAVLSSLGSKMSRKLMMIGVSDEFNNFHR